MVISKAAQVSETEYASTDVLVPTGYKLTEVGVLPEDWHVKLLPDVCRFRAGKAHEQYISNSGRFVCVNSKFISTNGKVRKYSTVNFCCAKRGDVLMVMSDLPNGKALAKAYLVDEDDLYAVNQRVCALTPYGHCSSYLFYALNRNRYFLKFDDGVNQTHLLNPVFQKCPLPLPPTKAEQEAIAESLSDLDALIESLEQLINKKRQIKQGTMQELLTGERRLPGFNERWEAPLLGSLFTFKNGLNKAKQFFGFGTPIVNYMDVYRRRGICTADIQGRVSLSKEELKAYAVQKGDVFFTRTSETVEEVGITSVMLDEPRDTVFSGFVLRARCKDDSLDDQFKRYCFSSSAVRKQITSKSTETTRALTNGKYLSAVVLKRPPKPEQVEIASVLNDMEDEIAALETKLAQTRQIKQGMMQDLLTGKVRLV
jgi:type I restriction enzyme S subunit